VGALTWWLSRHPDWTESEDWPKEVPVVRYETDEGVVLIDPFLPPEGSFDPGGKPVHVLLTQGAHYRGTAEFVDRYDASVWAPPRARWRKIPNPATTDELPRHVEVLELDGEPQQVLFLIPEHSTLVSGDVLTGQGGVMHVFVDDAEREPLLDSLERIAELSIERVIVPHCEEPVFLDGAAQLRAAVAEARSAR
jgi:glyoxylase-like metal-dependent hydrolase (beta-lactamase superfamily II)